MGKTCVCAALMLANPPPDAKGAELDKMKGLVKRTFKRKQWSTTIDGVTYFADGHATDLVQPNAQMYARKKVEYEDRVFEKGKFVKKMKYRLVRDSDKALPNPEHAKWKAPQVATFPVTVVLTTNALLGQWQDE